MKNLFTFLLCIGICFSLKGNMIITGSVDGPLLGGTKLMEVYIENDIPDLSIYGFGFANNGNGSEGQEYAFPAGSATAGTFLYFTNDFTKFTTYFGFDADYEDVQISGFNGNDALELYENGIIVDIFGNPTGDAAAEGWNYNDSWVYRSDNTGPDGTAFVIGSWTIQPVDLLDSTMTNAEALPPFPYGTYMQEQGCPTDLYVDASATGSNNGSSWTDAFTDLQDALAAADGICMIDIHVAAATYYPTSGTSRGVSFGMKSNIDLMGGYPVGGGERNPGANETILSGNVDVVNTYGGNSYNVVKAQNVTNVVIDGLSIRDGNADDAASFGRSRGGGVFMSGSSVTFINTVIKWNKAVFGGGLFATLSPDVTFESCTFKKNTAGNGGALYHNNKTNMYIRSSRIIDNTSTRCAIEVNNSDYTLIENAVIANNTSTGANAIGFIATTRNQACDIYNSTILGKTANQNLVLMQVSKDDQLDLNFYNSIIAHQNLASDKAFVAYSKGVLNLNTENCYIQGSSVIGTSSGNLYSAAAGDLMLNADYSLNECSPAVDMGNDANAGQLATDIDGNIRIVGTVDMGAYEAQIVCSPPMRETASASGSATVFPNPVKDVLLVRTELENVEVYIYDALGKSMKESNAKEIHVGEFPTGVYYLHIFSEGKLIATEKIVKQ